MKYRLKHLVEYGLLRGLTVVFGILPYRVSLFLAWLLALLSYAVLGSIRRRTRARLRQVFGTRFSERELSGIAWRAWRNLFFNSVEAMRFPSVTLEWIGKVLKDEGSQPVWDRVKAGRGVVVAVCHMGNWDLAGVAACLMGVPMLTIARRQKNPLTDAFLTRMRGKTGLQVIYHGSKMLTEIVPALRAGKVLAILPDLRAKTESVRVKFLGADADLPTGMARFAREAGVPILPQLVIRQGWGRHLWRAFEPIVPDPSLDEKQDWQRMTQYVMDCFSHAVHEHPDQYFWFNKRWVLGEERK
jgi:Kdo2-lipid IVA lauroyltransferase/acyltransferase